MITIKRFSFFLVCAVAFFFILLPDTYGANLPNVTIVTTGGTIAEKTDPKTGGAVPAVSGADLIEAVPSLAKIANIKVINFSNIDSSQMTPEIWAKLSRTVDAELSKSSVKGVVVTHGTDTMAEGAYFLSLTLKNRKPVAFVGAMRDASDLSPDGPANIQNAVIQVCSEEAKNWGVTVTLNEYINSAADVRKTQSTNVQTFNSGEKGYLGYISMGKVIPFHGPGKMIKLPLPEALPNVAIVSDYAGSDGSLLRYAVDNGAKGIVVDAVGAGNVNAEMYKAVQYAIGRKVPVVVTTRVFNGGVYPIYGDLGGGETMEKAGAILGGDLHAPKARLLLMLAIPQYNGDGNKMRHLFKH